MTIGYYAVIQASSMVPRFIPILKFRILKTNQRPSNIFNFDVDVVVVAKIFICG